MSTTATVKSLYYVVKSGDTLTKIATKYNQTLTQLLKWNPSIKNANLIYPNQSIKIGETLISVNQPTPTQSTTTTTTQEKTWTTDIFKPAPAITPTPTPTKPAETDTPTPVKNNSSGLIFIGIGALTLIYFLNQKNRK